MDAEEEEDECLLRLCDKCSQPVPSDWDYALCKACGEEPCKHAQGTKTLQVSFPGVILVAECNQCLIESDLEFDANRERAR